MNALLIDRLGWTLLHSLWQLAALALAMMLMLEMLRLLQIASARSRYFCAALTMLAMALAVPVTFLFLQADLSSHHSASMDPATAAGHGTLVPSPPKAMDTSTLATSATTTAPPPTWRQRISSVVQPWLTTIVGGWLMGVVLLAIRPVTGWCAVRRLRKLGTSPVPPTVLDQLHRAARRLGVAPTVQVVQSWLVQIPAVVGWLRPVILLPIGTLNGLTPLQLEAVLAHELAHIRRHDYLVNLLQTLVETLLFYHPAVWWVSHQMRLEREDCCDDLALLVCSDRHQYARTLLALDELRAAFRPRPCLPAAALSWVACAASYWAVRPRRAGRLAAWRAWRWRSSIVALGLMGYPPASFSLAEESAPADDARIVVLVASDLLEPQVAEAAPPATAETAPSDPWFWPDPYSHLGHDDAKGEGWHFLRVAADNVAGEELKTTPQQRKALVEIYRLFEERQRDLGKQLREEKADAAAWPARQKELWLKARDAARPLLTEVQQQRVLQLMIQRQTYNAFRSDELTQRLELSDDQRRKILSAIDAHLKRIADEELELGRSTERAAPRGATSSLPITCERWRRRRAIAGGFRTGASGTRSARYSCSTSGNSSPACAVRCRNMFARTCRCLSLRLPPQGTPSDSTRASSNEPLAGPHSPVDLGLGLRPVLGDRRALIVIEGVALLLSDALTFTTAEKRSSVTSFAWSDEERMGVAIFWHTRPNARSAPEIRGGDD